MFSLAATLALALAASCGPPPLSERPWGPGERLNFDVHALGATQKSGLSLVVDPVPVEGSPAAMRLAAAATFRSPFYKVRGAAQSWIDARTLLPTRFHDESSDGKSRSTDSQLDRPGPVVRVNWVNGGKRGMNGFLRGPAVLDLLSALYYLRAARLVAGTAFCFDVVGGRTYWRLSGHVQPGTEETKAPAGRADAIRLDGVAVQSDDPSRRYQLHLWLSADARRLPVAMTIETRLGRVRAALASAGVP
ncbi:MAG: hypothetical protein A2V77_04905 [Anaeromyxobacter sp. RBG_16_69_14]|nr:MAG: hypothetical protein A2V77_04905 [Anaeromyxobacter sp. RBG_16_69_14]